MLVTCILADFAADLSGCEWVYSLNRVIVLCINVGKIDFLAKNLLLGEKYFSLGKFAEWKTPIIGVTFLVKKKNNPDQISRLRLLSLFQLMTRSITVKQWRVHPSYMRQDFFFKYYLSA